MSLVLVPGIGVRRNDALRWINLAGIQFQPSEIMKVCFIIFVAYLICQRFDNIKKLINMLHQTVNSQNEILLKQEKK